MRSGGASGGSTALKTTMGTPNPHVGARTTGDSFWNGVMHTTQQVRSSGASDDAGPAGCEKAPFEANGSTQPSKHHIALNETAANTIAAKSRCICRRLYTG